MVTSEKDFFILTLKYNYIHSDNSDQKCVEDDFFWITTIYQAADQIKNQIWNQLYYDPLMDL